MVVSFVSVVPGMHFATFVKLCKFMFAAALKMVIQLFVEVLTMCTCVLCFSYRKCLICRFSPWEKWRSWNLMWS